ncbi:pro-Pol polyprotein [Trichonephila clavipes]|nr:pro-Pol polyprotein [Trichonephila clavipes]
MVINEKSTTTKCRVVFNASSKTKNGKSLNDVLMTGPKLQTEIFNHLIKFRSYRVAFAADIEKMYRQILISDEDCKYQRIVWRATPSDPLQSFELQTISRMALHAHRFSLAAKIARENIYLDDLLSGADTEVEAKSIIIEIQNLMKSGGFILRK